jgi:hypothetical protein
MVLVQILFVDKTMEHGTFFDTRQYSSTSTKSTPQVFVTHKMNTTLGCCKQVESTILQ